MADVAREAGVHTSTVSLALRHSPRIAVGTRERVEAAAERLGYHPNPLVTALMKNRRNPRAECVALTAGYLCFEALSSVLREEPVYSEFERGCLRGGQAARDAVGEIHGISGSDDGSH